jgi:shikimate dehydrogenase
MQIVAIIGDPIRQAQSPAVFGSYFNKHRIEAVMVPLQVTASEFERVLNGLRGIRNFAGLVVTIPHKMQACQIADVRGPMARATGTANVLAPIGDNQWSAEMFDGIGLLTALDSRQIEITGLDVLLIGAGGAGTAVAVALEQHGRVGRISIVETDPTRADTLATKLSDARVITTQGAPIELSAYQLIINTSPVGMRSNETPLALSGCAAGTIVCDAVMDPPRTEFLRQAQRKGCVIVAGLEMLQGQVEPLARYLGLAAPEDPPVEATADFDAGSGEN